MRRVPKNLELTNIQQQIALNGTFLSIDPASGASSQPGYALYAAGKLQRSGIWPLNKKEPLRVRLRQLAFAVHEWQQVESIHMIVIEKINGHMHHHLHQAIGAILGTIPEFVELVEIRPAEWTQHKRKSYVKSDENDAIEIGYVVVKLAKVDSTKNKLKTKKSKSKRRK